VNKVEYIYILLILCVCRAWRGVRIQPASAQRSRPRWAGSPIHRHPWRKWVKESDWSAKPRLHFIGPTTANRSFSL